jgi:hypothetical protein
MFYHLIGWSDLLTPVGMPSHPLSHECEVQNGNVRPSRFATNRSTGPM